MAITKLQALLVRMMTQIYAGLYKETAGYAITKEELEQLAIGWNTVIVDTLPVSGHLRTLYFIRGGTLTPGNIYDVYIWVETATSTEQNPQYTFEKVGQVSYDMKNHYTTAELEELLLNYRDVSDPIPLEASVYTDDSNFVKLYYTQDASSPATKLSISNDKGVTKYNLYNPSEAMMSELTEYYNDNSTLISSASINNCIDTAIRVIDGAEYEQSSGKKYAFLVTVGTTKYGTAPTTTVKNLTQLITTEGVTKAGQVSADYILLGGKIYDTINNSFVGTETGFTSIGGSSYYGVLACKNGTLYFYNKYGELAWTDNTEYWIEADGPIYKAAENNRDTFYGKTSNQVVYMLTVTTSGTHTKELLNNCDTIPHGSLEYQTATEHDRLGYLMGTDVYDSYTGNVLIDNVLECSGGVNPTYKPSQYRTQNTLSATRNALLARKPDGIYMVDKDGIYKLLSGSNCKISDMGMNADCWGFEDGRTRVYWPLVSDGNKSYIVLTDGNCIYTGINNVKYICGGLYAIRISNNYVINGSGLYNSALVVTNTGRVYVVYGISYSAYNEPLSFGTIELQGLQGDVVTGVYGGQLKFLVTSEDD